MASPSKIRQRKVMGVPSRAESYDRDDEDHVEELYRNPVRTTTLPSLDMFADDASLRSTLEARLSRL